MKKKILLLMAGMMTVAVQAQVSHEISVDGTRRPLTTLTQLTFDGDNVVMHLSGSEETQKVDLSRLTIRMFQYGDANGDDQVSITDAVGVVNKILNNPSDAFDPAAADVNRDGDITITDAVGVVNIILNSGSTDAPQLDLKEPESMVEPE